MMFSRRNCVALAIGAATAAFALAGPAAAYPTKPITIIVPFPAGAGPDVMARLLAERLGPTLKETVIVENRPGASGMVGATAVARAPADGHTLLLTPNTLFIAPHLMPAGVKPPVDVIADFAPVIMPSQTTMLMVANPKLGVKTAKEFAELAKTKPLNYASSGNGSVLHIAGALFANAAGVKLTHVPYRGIAPAVTDVIAGHVEVTFAGLAPVRQHINSGALVALAVVEPKRSDAMPQLPTAIEQGFKDVAVEGWYAVLAPKGTPQPIVDRLNKEINAILALTDFRQKVEQTGEVVLGGTPEALAKRVKADFDRYGEIVRQLNITAE
jgi:tripartite-type tricarboxylate transporter receptor subunit TctC